MERKMRERPSDQIPLSFEVAKLRENSFGNACPALFHFDQPCIVDLALLSLPVDIAITIHRGFLLASLFVLSRMPARKFLFFFVIRRCGLESFLLHGMPRFFRMFA